MRVYVIAARPGESRHIQAWAISEDGKILNWTTLNAARLAERMKNLYRSHGYTLELVENRATHEGVIAALAIRMLEGRGALDAHVDAVPV